MSNITKARLREALLALAAAPGGDDSAATIRLRQAFLDFGSETEDNLTAVARLEVGIIDTGFGRSCRGMRLAGTGIGLSVMINAAEGCPVPAQVHEYLPGATQDDWDAAMRLACLVLIALETDAG